jgi:hypothetical protein
VRALPLERKVILLLAVLSIGTILALCTHRSVARERPNYTAASSNRPALPAASPTATTTAPERMDKPPDRSAASPAPAPDGPSSVSGTGTLEREAVDALARGNFAQAASLYDRLVQVHPNDPLFREAARIARRKGAAHESRQ